MRPIAFHGERIRSATYHVSSSPRFGERYRDEIERAPGITAYLGANAVDLETPSTPNEVRSVRVACLSGSGFRVKARAVVLAAGGIENARLLLLANTVVPAGLGNAHDQVGRYFMEHLYLDRAASLLARRGRVSDFYTAGHWSGGRQIRGILGLSAELQRRERLTNFCAVLDDESLREAVASCRQLLARRAGALGYVGNTIAGVGAAVAARAGIGGPEPWTQRYLVKNVMEQAPNPESRVVLGADRDRLGCRRVELHWRMTALDKHTVHRAHELLGEELRRAGVGRLRSALGRVGDPWPPDLRGARHHMGTTRMHSDPRHGVVDADSRVHGVANLYVVGSSVFPTSGAANPTLTIVALALRLADHLKRVLVKAGSGLAVAVLVPYGRVRFRSDGIVDVAATSQPPPR